MCVCVCVCVCVLLLWHAVGDKAKRQSEGAAAFGTSGMREKGASTVDLLLQLSSPVRCAASAPALHCNITGHSSLWLQTLRGRERMRRRKGRDRGKGILQNFRPVRTGHHLFLLSLSLLLPLCVCVCLCMCWCVFTAPAQTLHTAPADSHPSPSRHIIPFSRLVPEPPSSLTALPRRLTAADD